MIPICLYTYIIADFTFKTRNSFMIMTILALINRKSKGKTFVLPHLSKIYEPVKWVTHTSLVC